jgi:hypothetical protein
MNDNADLEDKTVEALRHYRAALAAVENLEREGASAHRALTRILPDLGCALLEGEAPPRLFEIGSVAVSRSDEAWAALSEATVRLDSARLTLAALELQPGYFPGVSIAAGDPA